MDRRQQKTRKAIFNAFILLLAKKNYERITVEEIINLADVGRATFYAHFETKDFLLKDLCAELFDHLFLAQEDADDKKNLFTCDIREDVFLHLFFHIQKNDNNLHRLLSSKNNDLFLEYFKSGVRALVEKRTDDFAEKKPKILPHDFWINHITATFIETLKWWIDNEMKESPKTINEYFLAAI